MCVSPSRTRGRPVRAVLYQQARPLEYIWFSHGASVSALLYEQTVARMKDLRFTAHRDVRAIHACQAGKVVGLLWPNSYSPPHVAAAAQFRLRQSTLEKQQNKK